MGKVIKLDSYSKEYQKAVEEVIADLENMEQYMFDRSIGLLMVGKWRKWGDEQPIGTIFNFREKEMLEADDSVVNTLLELKETIRGKRKDIQKNNN